MRITFFILFSIQVLFAQTNSENQNFLGRDYISREMKNSDFIFNSGTILGWASAGVVTISLGAILISRLTDSSSTNLPLQVFNSSAVIGSAGILASIPLIGVSATMNVNLSHALNAYSDKKNVPIWGLYWTGVGFLVLSHFFYNLSGYYYNLATDKSRNDINAFNIGVSNLPEYKISQGFSATQGVPY